MNALNIRQSLDLIDQVGIYSNKLLEKPSMRSAKTAVQIVINSVWKIFHYLYDNTLDQCCNICGQNDLA